MAASPSYGDRPPLQTSRRSFTVPAQRKLSIHEQAGLEDSDANEELFYSHPSARIFAFAPPKESIISTNAKTLRDTDYPVDTVETLPWRSRTETLFASGKMIIEKVKGSTTFLKCQSVSHALMRNTQCWCVDNESKFVLRIRAFEYYRIEIPSQTESDKEKVEELKRVLAKLPLRYEKTPCPFKRAFHVDLPDDAMTPRRKGTWKPRESSLNRHSDTESPTDRAAVSRRDSGRRAPPTSYPRNAPVFSSPLSAERLVSSASVNGSPWSPLAYKHSTREHDSDEGSDQGSNDSDGIEEQENTRGRNVAPRQVSAPIPVSVRIASIERTRKIPSPKPVLTRTALTVDTDLNKQQDEVQQIENKTVLENDDAAKDQEDIQDGATQKPHQNEVDVDVLDHQNSASEFNNAVSITETVEEVPNNAELTVVDHLEADVRQDQELSASPIEAIEPETSVLEVPIVTEDVQPKVTNEPAPLSAPHTEVVDPESPTLEEPIVTRDVQSAVNDESVSPSEPDEPTDDVPAEYQPGVRIDVDTENIVKEKLLVEGDLEKPQTWADEEQSDAATVSDSSSALPDLSKAAPLEDQVIVNPKDDVAPTITLESNVDEQELLPETQLEDVKNDFTTTEDADNDDDAISIVSSADSFHTIPSNIQQPETADIFVDNDETPTVRHLDPFSEPSSLHRRGISELTVTDTTADVPVSSGTTTPTSEAINSGLRQRLRARRSFSPMPPESIIIRNPQPRPNHQHRDLARAALRLAVIVPFEAAIFFAHVLSRVIGGATPADLWSGELFRRPENRRRVIGIADRVNGNAVTQNAQAEEDNDGAHEDDFGVPLRGRQRDM